MSRFLACAVGVGLAVSLLCAADDRPVHVKIQDAEPDSADALLPLDPAKYVQYQAYPGMGLGVRVDNKALHVGQLQTLLKIDKQVVYPGSRVMRQAEPLPKTRSGKARDGVRQSFEHGPVHVTQTVEVVPARPAKPQPGDKRRLDAVLVRYTIDNKGTQTQRVGLRLAMNTYLIDTRRALFAAPTEPGKILNGVELKDGQVPGYVQILQNADLKNPGFIAHLTLRLHRKWEPPNRVVLTQSGAGGDGWNINAVRAGDSTAVALYWDPVELKPRSQRELAYGLGQSIATPAGIGGQVSVAFGGSFEPGKLFTVTAQIEDPSPGEDLTLEVPDGMQVVEGRERQPVPLAAGESPSVVLWKCRVLRPGDFRLTLRSSAGVTLTRRISITRTDK